MESKDKWNKKNKEKLLVLNNFYKSMGVGDLSAEIRTNDYGKVYIEVLSSNANNQEKEILNTCNPYLNDTQQNQLDFFLPNY